METCCRNTPLASEESVIIRIFIRIYILTLQELPTESVDLAFIDAGIHIYNGVPS